MLKFDFICKEELLVLLYQLLDGIEGYECEQGPAALRRYWKLEDLKRARQVIEQTRAEFEKNEPNS